MAPSRVNSRHFAHFTPYKTPFEGMKEATDGRERSRDKSCVLFTGSRHNKAPISGALIMFGAEGAYASTSCSDIIQAFAGLHYFKSIYEVSMGLEKYL